VPTAPSPAPVGSVVIDHAATAKKSKKGIVAWALAAVAALAAGAFGVLWAGKSSDADKLSKEKATLVSEKAGLQDELDTTKGDLDSTKKDLESTQQDLDSATGEKDDLQSKVDDLDSQVTQLEAELKTAKAAAASGKPSAATYAPRMSLQLGQSIGQNASPALTDAEASCLGAGVIDRVGVDTIFIDIVDAQGTPSDEVLGKLGVAGLRAADACGITPDRLGL